MPDAPASVDPWDPPPSGGKWRLCVACAQDRSLSFALVATLARGASQPPMAAPKLLGSVPLLLLCLWLSVVRPLPLGPLAPFAALGLALPALVVQCYLVSFPLTAGLAGDIDRHVTNPTPKPNPNPRFSRNPNPDLIPPLLLPLNLTLIILLTLPLTRTVPLRPGFRPSGCDRRGFHGARTRRRG